MDKQTLAEVLDARLHALWDPAGAEDRLATATEIVDLARSSADDRRAYHGLFWRFTAFMELARVAEAESALAEYERVARAAGDGEAAVIAMSRHAMLAILRGRFDEADRLIEDVTAMGTRVGLADTDRLTSSLRGSIAVWRDKSSWPGGAETFLALSRRLPGHFFETTAARILAMLGREPEASAELDALYRGCWRGRDRGGWAPLRISPRWLPRRETPARRQDCTARSPPIREDWWCLAGRTPSWDPFPTTSACSQLSWECSMKRSATSRRRSCSRKTSVHYPDSRKPFGCSPTP